MIGLGWWGFREDSSIFLLGLGIITLSVVLWIYEKEKE
jgi:cbb3-type cytochrome oxidase subunit 3